MYNYGGIYPIRGMSFGDNLPAFSMDYWTRSLYQRLTALINIKNTPAFPDQPYTWDVDALKYQLFASGYACVIMSKTYGLVPQPATLTGFGLQYQPTSSVLNSPYFQIPEPLKIGLDCQLIKLTPDYTGVFDIVTKYAAELKELDVSLKSAVRNARLGYAMIADSDKTARTLRNVGEKIANGDDVIIDEKLTKRNISGDMSLPWYLFNRDVKQSYIVGDLLDARRSTLVDFYREIGVRMLDDKKERMLTAEVAAGQAETFIRSEVWAEALKSSVERLNRGAGTNILVEINQPDFGPSEPQEVISDARE